jgi:hypothetical protein
MNQDDIILLNKHRGLLGLGYIGMKLHFEMNFCLKMQFHIPLEIMFLGEIIETGKINRKDFESYCD